MGKYVGCEMRLLRDKKNIDVVMTLTGLFIIIQILLNCNYIRLLGSD